MPRPGVTPAFATAIAAKVIRPFHLVRLQFRNDTLNLWTGLYPLTWGGITFTGAGSLISISGVSEDSVVAAKNVTIQLSGVSSDIITDAVNNITRGLSAQIYLGLFEDDGITIIPDPVLITNGRMDQPTISDGGDTCSIAISIESILVDMNRPVDRRYTNADCQLANPGDLGCQFVASIAEQTIFFGSLPASQNN